MSIRVERPMSGLPLTADVTPGSRAVANDQSDRNAKRGNGILNREFYIGRMVWNRQRFIKDPETGKRQARPNPAAEWIVQEIPELRVIDDELWTADRCPEPPAPAPAPFRNGDVPSPTSQCSP
jgi:site-specific DNA recombinase